jgi:hypothetical protein
MVICEYHWKYVNILLVEGNPLISVHQTWNHDLTLQSYTEFMHMKALSHLSR